MIWIFALLLVVWLVLRAMGRGAAMQRHSILASLPAAAERFLTNPVYLEFKNNLRLSRYSGVEMEAMEAAIYTLELGPDAAISRIGYLVTKAARQPEGLGIYEELELGALLMVLFADKELATAMLANLSSLGLDDSVARLTAALPEIAAFVPPKPGSRGMPRK